MQIKELFKSEEYRLFNFYKEELAHYGIILEKACKGLYYAKLPGDVSYAMSDLKEVCYFRSGVKALATKLDLKEKERTHG